MATRNRLPTEATRLVQATSRSMQTSSRRKTCMKGVCTTSPPVLLILAWTFVLGGIEQGTAIASHFFVQSLEDRGAVSANKILYIIMAVHAILAINNMTYPLGGLIADVWCGRYRIVMASLFFLWLCLASMTVLAIVHVSSESTTAKYFEYIFFALSLLLVIPALSGYTTNIIQLGFDQLRDKPSQSLGTFVHWLTWAHNLGATVVYLLNSVIECNEGNERFGIIIEGSSSTLFFSNNFPDHPLSSTSDFCFYPSLILH